MAHLRLIRTDCGMDWSTMIEEYDRYLQAAGRPSTTRDLRRWHLRKLAADVVVEPRDVTAADLIGWLTSHSWKPNTMRAYRGTLRSFFAWMVAGGLIEESPAAMLPAVKSPIAVAHPTPEEVWQRALQVAEPRVRVMIVLGARAGMRRAEIARARREDLISSITGADSLVIHGKGAKQRIVPLHPDVARLIRAQDEGWLFPSTYGGHLTADRVGRLLSEALGEGWSGHSLRHRFASACYSHGRDLLAVQALLGHSKSDTTRGYIALPDDALRAAVMAA